MREKRKLTDLDCLIINTTVGSAKHEAMSMMVLFVQF